jgi:hypothetical protein
LSTTTPATYSDPGFDNLAVDVPALGTQENFTSAIDWGEGTVDVGVLVEAPGGEGALTTGTVSGSHVYGDDGIYTVTVCVTDDDLATTCDTFTVTVNNVAPVFDDSVFLGAAVTFASLDDAFLGRKGVQQTHEALATDIGSDDLRYDWTFTYNPDNFGGSLPPSPETESTTTFNDGSATGTLPFSDPAREEGAGLHPHGTFPFTSGDSANVTFAGPGVYTVDVQVTDDNGGTDFATLPKIITDNCDCAKGLGFWKKEFKIRSEKDDKKVEKGTLIDEPTLAAYLDIIRFASSHFSEQVLLNSFTDAAKVLNPEKHRETGPGSRNRHGGSNEATNPSGTGSRKKNNGGTGSGTGKNVAKKREDALKHTFSAWLNFAKGAVEWDEPIIVEGGTGTGTKAKPEVVIPFNEVIAEVESILNNPDATHRELVHAKNLAESINKLDKGNDDCTGTGSKSRAGSKSGTGGGTASKSTKGGDDTEGSDSGPKQKGKKGK